MKLLFDQNLSHRLPGWLQDIFPDSIHVRSIGLQSADDDQVWEYAKNEGFAIASKDSDFHERSFLYGHPPKVIWLDLGNCTAKEMEAVLRKNKALIADFDADPDASFLILTI